MLICNCFINSCGLSLHDWGLQQSHPRHLWERGEWTFPHLNSLWPPPFSRETLTTGWGGGGGCLFSYCYPPEAEPRSTFKRLQKHPFYRIILSCQASDCGCWLCSWEAVNNQILLAAISLIPELTDGLNGMWIISQADVSLKDSVNFMLLTKLQCLRYFRGLAFSTSLVSPLKVPSHTQSIYSCQMLPETNSWDTKLHPWLCVSLDILLSFLS